MPNAWVTPDGERLDAHRIRLLVEHDAAPGSTISIAVDGGAAVGIDVVAETVTPRVGGYVTVELGTTEASKVSARVRILTPRIDGKQIGSTIVKRVTIPAAPPDPHAALRAERRARSAAAGIPEGFSGFHNVGVPLGASLAYVSRDVTIRQPGVVVTDLDVDGRLVIDADDVVVRRCRVSAAGRGRIQAVAGRRNLTIEDCEVDGIGGGGEWGLGGTPGLTIRRTWVHHCPDGIRLSHDTLVEDCLVTDLVVREGQHLDCAQATSARNVTIRRCTFIATRADGEQGNAALLIGADTGDIDAVTIEDCYFDGGNDTVVVKTPDDGFALSGVHISRCTFGPSRRYRALVVPKDESLTTVYMCRFTDGLPLVPARWA